jgi:hypothetical protein
VQELEDEVTQANLATDPIYRLEHAADDKKRAKSKKEVLTQLVSTLN